MGLIYSADKNKYSPPEWEVIKDIQCDLPIVLVTRIYDFVFNDRLEGIGDYILADLSELGWDESLSNGTHLFGKNTYSLYGGKFIGDEWKKFDDWVASNPPKIYFKRELLKKDSNGIVYPIEYPCKYPIPPIQSEDEFNNRSISVFNFWGRSSEDRVKVHADFWARSSINGAAVCDNIYYCENFIAKEENKNKWVTLHIPHYSRIGLEFILNINGISKLSLSQKGCGFKCFRHSESPINSIMVLEDDGMKYSFDWIDGYNCIMYKGDPIPAMEEALKRNDLWNIYKRGVATCKMYASENYTRHLENVIKSVL